MSMMRWMVRGAGTLGVGVMATVVGCMGAGDDEDHTGVAQIAITQVPVDGSVGCVAVTATGAASTTKKADVTPGSSSVIDLHGLPTGTVSFTGNAYAGPCSQVSPMSVPTWISDPVLATVSHVPVTVQLAMRRNGQATVDVDFPDPSCSADGAPCFNGSECCSNACVNNACGAACPTGFAMCNAACVDVSSDPQNCGACGQMCPPGFACSFGACLAPMPSCTNGIKDGSETDVDCGGSCPACADGQRCAASFDCQSHVCSFINICQAPTCSDGVRNGTETDVDCGGPSCAPCATGKACATSADCASMLCAAGLCQ